MGKLRSKRLIQAYKITPRRAQIRKLGLYILPVITLATVMTLYLIFSAQAAESGLAIRSLRETQEELQRVIANERTQLAWLTSYSNMIKRAEDLGFESISPDSIEYMVLSSYVGRRLELSSPIPGTGVSKNPIHNAAYQESLSDFISSLFMTNTYADEDEQS